MASLAFKMGKSLPLPFLMAVFAGSAVAAAVLLAPMGLIEALVSATGLTALVPAAAPPLGFTARALCAICGSAGAMTLTAAALALVDRAGRVLARRKRAEPVMDEEVAPRRRILAGGEEAEPRRPIFAESDLGASARSEAQDAPTEIVDAPYELVDAIEVIDAVEPVAEEQPELLDLSPIARAMWQVPPPLPALRADFDDDEPYDRADEPEFAEFAEFSPVEEEAEVAPAIEPAPLVEPVPAPAAPAIAAVDRDALTLVELVDRLERGLERRGRVEPAAAPELRAAAPAPSISDMDEALRDALGTLRRMSALSR